ncbi:ATP-dependent helicase [Wukongibacter baidiensis]
MSIFNKLIRKTETYSELMEQHEKLKEKYNRLYHENEELKYSYYELLEKESLLKKDVSERNDSINKLKTELKNKRNENYEITEKIEKLTDQVESYNEYYGKLPQKEIKDKTILDAEDDDYSFVKGVEERNGNPFNPKQLEAIRYNMKENLRIIAGAGSGKTETITTKAAYLHKVIDIPQEKICMLTFTRKAALEMEERVSKNLGNKSEMMIGTFHSVFRKLVLEMIKKFHFDEMSLNFNHKVNLKMYEKQIEQLIDKYNLKDFNQYDETKLKDRLSCWINAGYDATKICENVKKYLDKEFSKKDANRNLSEKLHHFMEDLNDLKEEENIIIFDDYLTKIPELISKNKEAQKYLRDRFSYIFIDEFQDTNQLQINVIKLIAPPNDPESPKLIIVGDDDQAIYLFRGSETKFIKEFDGDYSTVTIDLMTNYRSKAKEVVRMANSLISNNKHDRLQKPPMECAPFSVAGKYEVNRVQCNDDIVEANFILKKIKEYTGNSWYEGIHVEDKKEIKIIKEDKVPDYTKNVVLYRMRSQAETLITKLEMNDIDFVIKVEKKDCLGVFNNLNFSNTFKVWKEYYESSDYKSLLLVREKLLVNIGNLLFMNKEDAKSIIRRYDLSEEFINSARKIVEEIDSKKKTKANINEIIQYILDVEQLFGGNSIDIYKLGQSLKVFKAYQRIIRNNPTIFNNIISTCKETKTIEGLIKLYKIKTNAYTYMKDRYDLYLKEKLNALCLMTIHQSKGLSFENVFVIGNYEGGLPHGKAKSITNLKDRNYFKIGKPPTLIEEERRLFYVALTRAKENLHITYPILHGDQSLKPSRFLKELGTTNFHVVNE